MRGWFEVSLQKRGEKKREREKNTFDGWSRLQMTLLLHPTRPLLRGFFSSFFFFFFFFFFFSFCFLSLFSVLLGFCSLSAWSGPAFAFSFSVDLLCSCTSLAAVVRSFCFDFFFFFFWFFFENVSSFNTHVFFFLSFQMETTLLPLPEGTALLFVLCCVFSLDVFVQESRVEDFRPKHRPNCAEIVLS